MAYRHEIIIKPTHRALWYEDGVLTRIYIGFDKHMAADGKD